MAQEERKAVCSFKDEANQSSMIMTEVVKWCQIKIMHFITIRQFLTMKKNLPYTLQNISRNFRTKEQINEWRTSITTAKSAIKGVSWC